MALTVTEATLVNALLNYLLGKPSPSGSPVPGVEAMQAACSLADRANATLSAGLNGSRVREAWTASAPSPARPLKAAVGRRNGAAARKAGKCYVCGCTDDRGCDVGCWWVLDDLCSACVEIVTDALRGGPVSAESLAGTLNGLGLPGSGKRIDYLIAHLLEDRSIDMTRARRTPTGPLVTTYRLTPRGKRK